MATIVALPLTIACSTDNAKDPFASGPQKECEFLGDCFGDRPVCDPLDNACVECLFDAQCPGLARCEDKACVATAECASSADCSAPRPVCDVRRDVCEECVYDSDCAELSECVNYRCSPYTPCNNSLDCSTDEVCDEARDRCVDCLTDSDCTEEEWCNVDACEPRTTCDSDKDCTPSGRLCQPERSLCVQCLDHDDCPGEYFCSARLECAVDVCIQGGGICDGRDVLLCNRIGDGYEPRQCGFETTCASDGNGFASCSDWVCAAGMKYCDGERAVDCAADGLSVVSQENCADGDVCSGGECKPVICAPYKYYCEENEIFHCSPDGTNSTSSAQCLPSQYCEDGRAMCLNDACTAGALGCVGSRLATCSEDGSGFEPGATDCADSAAACVSGACVPTVCVANSYFCGGDGHVHKCTTNGTASSLYDICPTSQYCTEGDPSCNSDLCSAGLSMCDGTRATTCAADGSGPALGGTECANTGQVCVSGICVAKICEPNSFYCADGHVQRCASNGASTSRYDTCSTTEYCTNGDSTCNYDVCTNGAASCDADTARKCKADGSGYEAATTDCSLTGDVCAQGFCLPKVCEKNAYFCQDGNVQRCDAYGASATLRDTCTQSEFCRDGTSSCLRDVCTADEAICNGDVATTCSADGGTPKPGGTDCAATGQVCQGGVCKPKVCTPSEYLCAAGNVVRCDAEGAGTALYDTCTAAEFCKPGQSYCAADVCENDAKLCAGDIATQCEADGSALEAGGTDCSASGKNCLLGSCSDCDPRAALRIAELSPGSVDYFVIENTSATCKADLNGLVVSYRDNGTRTLAMPALGLNPGEKLYVTESKIAATDVVTGLYFSSTSSGSGHVMLCDGPCASDASNVIDAVAYGTSTLPSNVPFVPSTLSISLWSDANSYHRVAYVGSLAGGFRTTDWAVAARSR